jgi:hypothetical protein
VDSREDLRDYAQPLQTLVYRRWNDRKSYKIQAPWSHHAE